MPGFEQTVEHLKKGVVVELRPRGNSMKGKIESGDLVTIAPVRRPEYLKKGDIVMARVKGKIYIHLIKAIDGQRFQIGNNRGFTNGWCGPQAVYGKVIKINDRVLEKSKAMKG